MTSKDELKVRTLRLMERVDHEAVARMPGTLSRLTPGQFIVTGLFLSCWANYRGVVHLVRHDLAEPAMVLCRSLVLDAVRLAYFARHKGGLECLMVQFNHESLRYEEGFLKAAQTAGEDIGDRLARGPQHPRTVAAVLAHYRGRGGHRGGQRTRHSAPAQNKKRARGPFP